MERRLAGALAALTIVFGGPGIAKELSATPSPNEAPAQQSPVQQAPGEQTQDETNPRLAAAIELLDATNGQQMGAYQLQFLCNDYIAEYHQTHSKASNEDLTLFAATLDEEAGNALDNVTMQFAQSFAHHFTEDELHGLTAFAESDLYKRFTTALPQPLSGMGLFNFLVLSSENRDAKARRFYELYAKFESADDLKAMKDFLQSELGRKCVTELKKISDEMTYSPGWLTKEVEKAKDRTIARLHLKGVKL